MSGRSYIETGVDIGVAAGGASDSAAVDGGGSIGVDSEAEAGFVSGWVFAGSYTEHKMYHDEHA